jgi:hypothetical protein
MLITLSACAAFVTAAPSELSGSERARNTLPVDNWHRVGDVVAALLDRLESESRSARSPTL